MSTNEVLVKAEQSAIGVITGSGRPAAKRGTAAGPTADPDATAVGPDIDGSVAAEVEAARAGTASNKTKAANAASTHQSSVRHRLGRC
jgi:hypothetical protein